jgi:hypothetical protein
MFRPVPITKGHGRSVCEKATSLALHPTPDTGSPYSPLAHASVSLGKESTRLRYRFPIQHRCAVACLARKLSSSPVVHNFWPLTLSIARHELHIPRGTNQPAARAHPEPKRAVQPVCQSEMDLNCPGSTCGPSRCSSRYARAVPTTPCGTGTVDRSPRGWPGASAYAAVADGGRVDEATRRCQYILRSACSPRSARGLERRPPTPGGSSGRSGSRWSTTLLHLARARRAWGKPGA